MDSVRNVVKDVPGLFLGGNFISGSSVGDCISYGAAISSSISSYLLESRFK